MIENSLDNKHSHDDFDDDVDTIGLEELFYRESNHQSDNHNDSNNDELEEWELIEIENCKLYIKVPEDNVGTLFCDHIWYGSKVLGKYIYNHQEDYINKKRIIEFGAATAIPSLISLFYCLCDVVVITDYPDPLLIKTIQKAIQHNVFSLNQHQTSEKNTENNCNVNNVNEYQRRFCVMGHEWGKPIEAIQTNLATLLNISKTEKSCEFQEKNGTVSTLNDQNDRTANTTDVSDLNELYFDTLLLSECIWMHRCHEELLQSIDQVLHPIDGAILMTYTHHIPGCENADNRFFEIASQKYRFRTVLHEINPSPYMFDNTKSVDIHLKVLQRH